MKKWLFLFVICLCNLTVASPIQDHEIDPTALSQLGSALDIPQDADIIIETQKHWLRNPIKNDGKSPSFLRIKDFLC